MAYGAINVEQMTTQSGYTLGAGNASSFKNRIINGGQVIDQRNAGASVSNSGYITDRFALDRGVSTATVTGQQSSTVPSSGFTNSVVLTVTAGAATTAGDYSVFRQAIEGYNVADLRWGTASAQTVTLSFWVRSSLTGTFGVSFNNSAQNRYYVGSYTISAANTWEQKSITVPGDQSGTWLTTNSAGINLYWDIGVGTTYSAAAGSWGTGTGIYGLTGGVKLLANTGATLYITGVQLEVGTVATSFDYRSIGTELALCQRYLYAIRGSTALSNQGAVGMGVWNGSNGAGVVVPFPVQLRAYPSSITVSSASDFQIVREALAWETTTSIALAVDGAGVQAAALTVLTGTLDTRGFATRMRTNASGAYLGFNAEL